VGVSLFLYNNKDLALTYTSSFCIQCFGKLNFIYGILLLFFIVYVVWMYLIIIVLLTYICYVYYIKI
jgi:hypothetical protein